jgi:hypothetical protein
VEGLLSPQGKEVLLHPFQVPLVPVVVGFAVVVRHHRVPLSATREELVAVAASLFKVGKVVVVEHVVVRRVDVVVAVGSL